MPALFKWDFSCEICTGNYAGLTNKKALSRVNIPKYHTMKDE